MRRGWLLTLPVVAGIAGCSARGLAFVQDERIEVLTPGDREEVTLPLTVRWAATDLPQDATIAVAVDGAPPRPGEAPAEDDQIVRSDGTEVTLDHLGTTSRAGGRGLHRITLFLLDDEGERLGESAWRVDVHLEEGAE